MKTDAPHCHYGGEELFCAYENSRFGFYTATTVLHRKGALFNFAYTLAPYQHDYFQDIIARAGAQQLRHARAHRLPVEVVGRVPHGGVPEGGVLLPDLAAFLFGK